MDPFPLRYLFKVDFRCAVIDTEEHMIQFMFGKPVVKCCFVYKAKYFIHLALKTHLFKNPSPGGLFKALTGSWMAAAGIGPQSRRVILG